MPNGDHWPPPFEHYVDDSGNADVHEYVEWTVAASTIALYYVLGFPATQVPDPQSKDKLDPVYDGICRFVGHQWELLLPDCWDAGVQM